MFRGANAVVLLNEHNTRVLNTYGLSADGYFDGKVITSRNWVRGHSTLTAVSKHKISPSIERNVPSTPTCNLLPFLARVHIAAPFRYHTRSPSHQCERSANRVELL